MSMTNYMALLAMNQPWNILLYMVLPVGLAEALVATEFFTLYYSQQAEGSCWKKINKYIGIVLGFYFLAVDIYLLSSVIPHLQWHGPIDVIAVVAYLLGVFPLLGISLFELGVFGQVKNPVKVHFLLLIAFLVVSHIAMIFGMLDPNLIGSQTQAMPMHHGHTHG